MNAVPPLPPDLAAGDATPPLDRPRSPAELFTAFSLLALQGFGGVVAIVQRELVEKKRWMSREQFLEDWAVVRILPGPNVMNLALLMGDRYFGLRGALAAMSGMVVLPLLIVIGLALVYAQFADNPQLAGALRGMAAAAAGMIVATGLKLFGALRQHPLGRTLCIAIALLCFVAVAVLRWPLFAVLVVLGGVSCALVWRRIAP